MVISHNVWKNYAQNTKYEDMKWAWLAFSVNRETGLDVISDVILLTSYLESLWLDSRSKFQSIINQVLKDTMLFIANSPTLSWIGKSSCYCKRVEKNNMIAACMQTWIFLQMR